MDMDTSQTHGADGPEPHDAPGTDSVAAGPAVPGRVFLVVVDDSDEMNVALQFACRRASSTGGRVALLYVIEPADFQHWMGVGKLMEEERRQEAEQVLQKLSGHVMEWTGSMPILHVREGDRRDELLALIDEEPGISVLVLGASTGAKGPGPLVSQLSGKFVGKLRVPLTIVPGNMTDEQIDAVT